MPVHYINISRDYADDIEAQAVKTGLQPFRTDLNVMMASSTNIQGQMEQVDTDLGYTWDSYTDPNSVRIGVNWGYTSSHIRTTFVYLRHIIRRNSLFGIRQYFLGTGIVSLFHQFFSPVSYTHLPNVFQRCKFNQ